MKLNDFFSQNDVFTLDELKTFLSKNGKENPNTRNSLLLYYQKQGRLLRVRRGLYATVPPGSSPDSFPVDPYLLTSKMTKDSVLAYHTALSFYGKAYSFYNQFYYLTHQKSQPLNFRGYKFVGKSIPQPLINAEKETFGISYHTFSGSTIKVTNFERTLVDVLARPELTGSWEEIWRSLKSIEFFDLDIVLQYTTLLNNTTTAAKVGFFLEQNRESLMVDDKYLKKMMKLRPKKPHYLNRNNQNGGKLIKKWNLIVPDEILHERWGEIT